MRCFIKDQLVFDVSDSTYADGGIGLSNAGGHTHFDDVIVTSLADVQIQATKHFQVLQSAPLVHYTIEISNTGTLDQPNNSDPEFEDLLPNGTQLFPNSEKANSGNVSFDAATNCVLWNGSIPAGGSVTINFTVLLSNSAEILSSSSPTSANAMPTSVWLLNLSLIAALLLVSTVLLAGKRRRALLCACLLVMLTVTLAGCPIAPSPMLCNQGQVNYDPTGDGTNDAVQLTDDPSTAEPNDATCFGVTAIEP